MKQRKRIGILLENLSIALILIGFVAMIQPFTMQLYSSGFPIALAGVVLFNIASHI